jgi:heat shock protein HslJ
MRRALKSAIAFALVLVAACEAAAPTIPLAGKSWTLIELGGEATTQTAPAITLTIAENRASGFAGCNTFGGAFSQAGAKVQFLELAATRKACAEAATMTTEAAYLEALSAAATARSDGAKLLLESAGGETLAVFTANQTP